MLMHITGPIGGCRHEPGSLQQRCNHRIPGFTLVRLQPCRKLRQAGITAADFSSSVVDREIFELGPSGRPAIKRQGRGHCPHPLPAPTPLQDAQL